jgi:hypothetical protein
MNMHSGRQTTMDPAGASRPGDASPGVQSHPAGHASEQRAIPSGPLLPRRLRLRSWAARRRRSLIGWSVLAVALIVNTVTRGIPLSEDTVLVWLAAALFVASLDDLKRWRRGVLRDWLPLYLVLALDTRAACWAGLTSMRHTVSDPRFSHLSTVVYCGKVGGGRCLSLR